MFKPVAMVVASGLAAAALIPGIASAHTDLSIGVNLGAPYPVYAAPAPVIVERPAPAVVYAPTPPVVYQPAPVVYGPPVVYVQPYWNGYRWVRGGERRWR